ncbi:MAG: universal stress protein [Thermodesulfobacteriota bacterium]
MSPLKPVRKILCPVDFSEFSRDTLDEALLQARKFDAELLLLNVINERLFHDIERLAGRVQIFNGALDQAKAALEEERAGMLEQLAAEVGLDQVRHRLQVTVGVPWEKILEAAERERVDLIVMGTKGRGALTRQLRFGSSAEKVFRRAQCRVLFVR